MSKSMGGRVIHGCMGRSAVFAILFLVAGVASAGSDLRITTLSTLPDKVTGGDVLIGIDIPRGLVSKVRVKLNGQDVTRSFIPAREPRAKRDRGAEVALVGLLSGLRDGENKIVAEGPGEGSHRASLTIVNSPIGGPVFSGPHQKPFVCTTDRYGLGASSVDVDCNATAKTEYFYRSSLTSTFKPLVDPANHPADLARTTTTDGAIVDYIVRLETGSINRHIYWVAILDNPLAPVTNPWASNGRAPGARWNQRLVYFFGGGCGYGYHQGTEAANTALINDFLSLGYAVVHATNNTAGQNCNDVLSAESAMMVKEHFIEQFGLPEYTTGFGGSGGAFQQRLLAHNYPGILDGLILQLPFPDTTTINARGLDCSLLENYYARAASQPAAWTFPKQAAVNGYAMDANGRTLCKAIHPSLGQFKVDPRLGFDAVVSVALRYDPVTNPTGARATIWDNMVNIFGIDRATGFARVSYDNIGVQYGLKALNDGVISNAEFLDLNERIGGYSVDGDNVPVRSVGNLTGIAIEYQTGRVVTGSGLILPMIEIRQYLDDQANVHDRVWTFAMKERMLRDKGHTDNLVAWVYASNLDQSFFTRLALQGMDDWLKRISAAGGSAEPVIVGDGDHEQREERRQYDRIVIQQKPNWLGDACWDSAGQKTEEVFVYNAPSRCNTLFPTHLMPRMTAGGPLTNDVFKCSLKSVDLADYAVSFTTGEQQRLRNIFPQGVCDWSAPAVERRPFLGTWQSFGEAANRDRDRDDNDDHDKDRDHGRR
jgi:Tannase-like family of unknown function (DUF6351)